MPLTTLSARVLGYAEITADFTTTAVVPTDVTGLSTTVTVPSGGRVKITAWAAWMEHTAATTNQVLSIREGSTTLAEADDNSSAASARNFKTVMYCSASVTAGSHTYKVSVVPNQAGTQKLAAAATYPAFILVEWLPV